MSRLAALALLATAAAAAPDPAVYTCHVDVTGTDARNRPSALAQCVRDVLVKLSGDPALADDPRPLPDAAAAVQDFAYLDLMTDIPIHDEQGTRDRPFDLLGHVDPATAEATLRCLGITPWTAPRPTLHVQVTVVDRKGVQFDLTGDGERGERQRRALLEAGERFALRVALPAEGSTPPPPLLTGTLRWSDADFGWNADWSMPATGSTWAVRGVSFDSAFRAGVGGASLRLAHAQSQQRR